MNKPIIQSSYKHQIQNKRDYHFSFFLVQSLISQISVCNVKILKYL